MEESFKVDIISPEKIIFSGNSTISTIPSYEGDMSILKNHISIITFLRPGIIKVQKGEGNFENFFGQDGTVEFYDNNLVVLTSTAINIKDISKEFIDNLIRDTEKKLNEKDLTDHDRYVLNYKQDTIKEIKI